MSVLCQKENKQIQNFLLHCDILYKKLVSKFPEYNLRNLESNKDERTIIIKQILQGYLINKFQLESKLNEITKLKILIKNKNERIAKLKERIRARK